MTITRLPSVQVCSAKLLKILKLMLVLCINNLKAKAYTKNRKILVTSRGCGDGGRVYGARMCRSAVVIKLFELKAAVDNSAYKRKEIT